ncbi:transposase [Trichodesmium erythraeum 21-75]|nr:transposase [Trichodesmium erythraeum 21-75]
MGYANLKAAQLKIARLLRKVVSIRQNGLHKLRIYLTENHGKIVIENLNFRVMFPWVT